MMFGHRELGEQQKRSGDKERNDQSLSERSPPWLFRPAGKKANQTRRNN
jgi:hypothetical protein